MYPCTYDKNLIQRLVQEFGLLGGQAKNQTGLMNEVSCPWMKMMMMDNT
jgi:hypothetical protein